MTSSRPSAFRKHCAAVAATALLLQPLGAYAAPITTSVLSEIPLQGLNPVKPNIMFTVDDSGSMTWDYLPDWVVWNSASPHPNYCRDGRQCGGNSGVNVGSSPLPTIYTPYQQVDPPLRSSDFNRIYYNPTAIYEVGRRDDGTGLPCEGSATGCTGPWNRVYMNGFAGYPGANTSTIVNLAPTAADIAAAGCVAGAATPGLCVLSSSVTAPTNNSSWAAGVPDTLWCWKTSGLTGADYLTADGNGSVCRRNGRFYPAFTSATLITPAVNAGYNYPNNSDTCTNTGPQRCKFITPITAYGYPFYYTISSVQFCTGQTNGWGTGTCGTRQDFASTKYVRYAAGTAAPGFNAAVFTRVDITPTGCRVTPGGASANGALNPTCPSGRLKDQEYENFAKFYAFNRTRILAMKTAAGIAFSALSDKNSRVGFHTLWENDSAAAGFLNVTPFDTANKKKWFSHLYAVAPNNGTPLPNAVWRIGEYFSGNLPASTLPGAAEPLDATTGQCQPNYHLLSTDGYWNAKLSYASRSDNDNKVPNLANLPGATGFTLGANFPRPYYEGSSPTSDNLADLAMYYWIRDIRPGLPNDVKDPIAPWQHVTLYGLSLGAQGNIIYPNGIDAIAAGANTVTAPAPQPINWPVATGAGGPESIDDLWHAAFNTRGQFFNADNPQQLADRLVRALADFTGPDGTGTGIATAGAQISTTKNFGYLTSYDSEMSGDVKKYALDPKTGVLPADIDGNPISPPLWSAATQLDAQALGTGWDTNRRILTINDETNLAVPFRHDDISAAQRASLNAGWSVVAPTPTAQSVLDYLRGDKSNVGAAPTNFRARSHVLGDIVYSGAVPVGAPSQPYLDAGNPGYQDFVTSKAARTPMVYVGSNDGMVHAIDDSPCLLSVCSTAEDAGKETWAFIPKALFSNDDPNRTGAELPTAFQLGALSYRQGSLLPKFEPKFRVNATPRAWDYDFRNTNTNKPPPSGNDWRTILVGGLGAGGRSIYALDITNPVTPSEKEPDIVNRVMWEFTDANLGYVFDAPTVVKTYRYGWVVLVASGYNNPGGKGILYVLNPADGKILKQLSPDVAADLDPKSAKPAGVPSDADPRGLSTIRAYTASRKDPYVLQAYGGDLKGNVWRFDLSDPDESKWNVALIAKLTDPGGKAQPITTGVRIEIDQNNNVDRYLFVGTGMLLGQDDLFNKNPVSNVRNTLYVIRDGTRTAAEAAPVTPYSRKDLNAVTGSGVAGFAGAPTGRGWYQDAADSTQKIINDVFADVQTVVFAFSKPTTDPCLGDRLSTLYARDFITGNSVLQSAGGAVVPSIDIGGISGVALIQDSSGDVYLQVTTLTATPGPPGCSGPGCSGQVFSFGVKLAGASPTKHRVSWRLLNRD